MIPRPDPALQTAMQQLYDRYAYAVDELDTEVLSDCYVDDASFRCTISAAGSHEGREAIVQRQVFRHEQEAFREKHLITGVVVLEVVDDRARTYANGAIYATRDGVTRFEASGHYEDEVFRCPDGQWRFRTRTFVGDHVAAPVTAPAAG